MDEQAGRRAAAKLERAIVLELLAGEGEQTQSCAELASALAASERDVEEAVQRLRDVGIVAVSSEGVMVTPAVLRLDDLGLIGI